MLSSDKILHICLSPINFLRLTSQFLWMNIIYPYTRHLWAIHNEWSTEWSFRFRWCLWSNSMRIFPVNCLIVYPVHKVNSSQIKPTLNWKLLLNLTEPNRTPTCSPSSSSSYFQYEKFVFFPKVLSILMEGMSLFINFIEHQILFR